MPDKEHERFYLRQLRKCPVGVPEVQEQDNETPDFLIPTDGYTLGIEFTQFYLPHQPGERPYKEVRSLQRRVIELAERVHTAAGGPALYLFAMFGRHGRIAKDTVQPIGTALASALLSYPMPRSARETLQIPRDLLPPEVPHVHVTGSVDGEDRLWQGDNASWVAPITTGANSSGD